MATETIPEADHPLDPLEPEAIETAYEILTGERPYPESKTRFGKMQPHLNVAPVKPRKYNPLIPVPLEHVILKAMEKARDRRYQTMDALMRDAQMVCNTLMPHTTAAAG